MAWGGPPAGSPFMTPGGQAAATANGLPFAGVPAEMQAGVERILDREPEHPEPVVDFSHVHADDRPFTLRSFLRPHRTAMLMAFALVVVETLTIQAGPLLTQIGIDHGVLERDKGTLVAAAIA